MPATYDPIATQTLGSAAASITFSSIPATYTDLFFVVNGNNVTAASYLFLRFNNDTGSNYSYTNMIGDGSATASQRQSSISLIRLNANQSGSTSIWKINVMNYSNTTTNKTMLSRFDFGGTSGGVEAFVGLWRSTSAINRVDFIPNTGNLAAGMTITLYGIKAA